MIDRLSEWLTPGRRKTTYTLVATLAALLVGMGLVDQAWVTSWLGVLSAALAAAALVMASIKARRPDMTAAYAVAAAVILGLRAAGVVEDGSASHWMEIISALAAAAGPAPAAARTDPTTPTGEPAAEYDAHD